MMKPSEQASLLSIIIYEALFLFSGFFQTLVQQFLYYQGAAAGTSLLTNTAMYIGMASVGLFLLPEWLSKESSPKINDYEMEEEGSLTAGDYQLLPEGDEETSTDNFTDTDDSPLKLNSNNNNMNPPKEVIDYKIILVASCLDFTANFALTIGFFYVGSGMYQVIYSSVVIWCAILSFFFLGRKLSVVQSISIVGVSVGLALSALGINHNEDHTTPPPSGSTGTTMPHSYHMSNTMFGMVLTSFATFGYACVYVVSDQILTTRKQNALPPSPIKACFLIGTCSTILSFIYLLIYTFPNWNSIVTQEMAKKAMDNKIPHASTLAIIWLYILMIFASFIHNIAYYWLMKQLGNVSTGLLNSLRAIVVFGLSDFMFCKFDPGQCFNIWKGWSAVIVIGFVTVFSVSKARESK